MNTLALAVFTGSCAITCLLACLISAPELDDSSDSQDVTCLLQSIGTVYSSKESSSERVLAKRPLTSDFFGSFSEDESTYTNEGLNAKPDDPFRPAMYGRDPHTDANHEPGLFDQEYFQESRSGGPTAAWQTNPAVPTGAALVGSDENPWRFTPHGWKEEYNPSTNFQRDDFFGKRPGWFDNSVHQVDGVGRQLAPGQAMIYYVPSFTPVAGRTYIAEGWIERSVNTTLTCKDPGCVARASLQLYDASKEYAKLCKLSIDVHPTDFDDDHSTEHVEYLKVNDYLVSRECNPKVRGCNASAELPLYPCVNERSIDGVVDRVRGNIVIEGKITQWVDECPVAGNLFSAVAMATCMIRDKVTGTTTTTTMTLFTLPDLEAEAILNCTYPGCMAEATLSVSPAIALNGGKCTMVVNVTQTDFDDHLGRPEEISYLRVEGQNMTAGGKPVKPGKNPCNEGYHGKNVSAADRIFQAVKDYDVTQLILNHTPHGVLKVVGKITPHVDECAYDGNLLYALVRLKCVPPANFSATPPPNENLFLHRAELAKVNNVQLGTDGS